MRGEQFYEADKLEWALNTFREAMQYISAAYYPASLVFYPMESNLGYRPGVSKEVFACLDDEQVNVYRDICNQLVLPAVAKERPDVVGVSIGTQMQLIAGLTFCKMIKETFPKCMWWSAAMSSRGCRKNCRSRSGSSPRSSTRRFSMKGNMRSCG